MVAFSHSMEGNPPAELAMLPDESASRAVDALEPGRRLVGMTKGQFSLLDLLSALLAKTGPAAVTLSTWTAGIRDAKSAAMLLERGAITDLRLLVDRSFATRQPAYCAAVRRLFGDAAIRCTRTHAKLALVRNERWNVAVRSSMNLNRNPRFEQYDIDDSAELCDFFAAHFAEMTAEMPPGPELPTSEVDAVFDRALRGINPFKQTDRDYLLRAGAPLDGDAREWRAWVVAKLREVARAKRQPRSWTRLAKAAGIPARDLRAAMAEAPSASAALSEDVARALVEALEA